MENLPAQQPATETPANVPPKFFDKDKNEIRVDALLKSYLELEKKLAQAKPENLLSGIPATPDDYQVQLKHNMFTTDADINKTLHDKGFTNDQVQCVYDLAAEKLVPMILEIAQEFEAERQLDRLTAAFGSKEKFAEISRQLLAYGKKNLPQDVLDGLSSTYEGVMALYRMMQSGKPLAIQQPDQTPPVDEKSLKNMMQDPKYWREKDPKFIKKVSDGFQQVYADKNQG